VGVLLAVAVVVLPILLIGLFLVPVPPLEGTVPPEQLADLDSLFVEVNGLQVHYRTAGQGEPTLVLLHGLGASVFSWREVIATLAESGKVIALVITGDDDRIVPTEQSARLAAELPNAELVVIPACGHVPQEACPGVFLQATADFLAALP
jgi:pimeloyl-ACP methyl ester carboxylesterase